MKAYQELKTIFSELSMISSISSSLSWDMEVMLPSNAISERGKQLSFLADLYSSKLKARKIEGLIADAQSEIESMPTWDKSNLYIMERMFKSNICVPTNLLAQCAELSNNCSAIWRDAYHNDDWNLLEPHLEKLVEIVTNIAEIKGDKLGLSPYDVLLDEYDMGSNTQQLDDYFTVIEHNIPQLLDDRLSKQRNGRPVLPSISVAVQKKAAVKIMEMMGFDFSRGRLDISTHPFCNGSHNDIRITTRYNEANPITAIYGIIHETGHAMYEMQLPLEWYDQPVGRAAGMAMHESQSLLAEMQIGLSESFIASLCDIVPELGDPAMVKEALQFVTPSFVRVEADELSYPLHIMLRYKIERMLIAKEIKVRDIPAIWNDYMIRFLKVEPPSNKLGCLQDIHWPSGAFGYFPCYTIGAMIAAHLMHFIPSFNGIMNQPVNFTDIFAWLKENIHKYGSYFLNKNALLRHATNSDLDATFYIEHLRRRYISST